MCVPGKLPSALSCLAGHTSAPQRLRIIFEPHGQEVVKPLSVQLCFFWLGWQNLLPSTQLAPNRIPFASRLPAKSFISSKWSFTHLVQQNQVCSKHCGLYFFLWIDLRLHCTPNKEINLIIWCHTLSWAKKKKVLLLPVHFVHSSGSHILALNNFWLFPHTTQLPRMKSWYHWGKFWMK